MNKKYLLLPIMISFQISYVKIANKFWINSELNEHFYQVNNPHLERIQK